LSRFIPFLLTKLVIVGLGT